MAGQGMNPHSGGYRETLTQAYSSRTMVPHGTAIPEPHVSTLYVSTPHIHTHTALEMEESSDQKCEMPLSSSFYSTFSSSRQRVAAGINRMFASTKEVPKIVVFPGPFIQVGPWVVFFP